MDFIIGYLAFQISTSIIYGGFDSCGKSKAQVTDLRHVVPLKIVKQIS